MKKVFTATYSFVRVASSNVPVSTILFPVAFTSTLAIVPVGIKGAIVTGKSTTPVTVFITGSLAKNGANPIALTPFIGAVLLINLDFVSPILFF